MQANIIKEATKQRHQQEENIVSSNLERSNTLDSAPNAKRIKMVQSAAQSDEKNDDDDDEIKIIDVEEFNKNDVYSSKIESKKFSCVPTIMNRHINNNNNNNKPINPAISKYSPKPAYLPIQPKYSPIINSTIQPANIMDKLGDTNTNGINSVKNIFITTKIKQTNSESTLQLPTQQQSQQSIKPFNNTKPPNSEQNIKLRPKPVNNENILKLLNSDMDQSQKPLPTTIKPKPLPVLPPSQPSTVPSLNNNKTYPCRTIKIIPSINTQNSAQAISVKSLNTNTGSSIQTRPKPAPLPPPPPPPPPPPLLESLPLPPPAQHIEPKKPSLPTLNVPKSRSASSSSILIPKSETNSTSQIPTGQTSLSSSSAACSNNTTTAAKKQSFACLRNLGSTCYINCIIQVMRYTPGFVLSIHRLNKQIDYLKTVNCEIENEINGNNDITFVRHLYELLVEMSEKEKLDRRPIYTPRKFVSTVWRSLTFWADGSQQDAHEFLQYTIHYINECELFIRQLHQKYQLKNIPTLMENTSNAPCPPSQTFTQSITLTNKFKKPSKQKQQQQQQDLSPIVPSTSTEPAASLIMNEDSSSSSSSSCSNYSSSTSTSSLTTSSNGSSNGGVRNLIKAQTRLLPSSSTGVITHMPTIDTLGPLPIDYMRTPTKGGASMFNIAALDSLMSSSQSFSSSASSQQTNSEEREPIKIKLKNTDNTYKIISNSLIINDKDLVSKRLKETLQTSESSTTSSYQSSNSTNTPKRIKCEPDTNCNSNSSGASTLRDFSYFPDHDNSNVIVIDSDDDQYVDDIELKYTADNCPEVPNEDDSNHFPIESENSQLTSLSASPSTSSIPLCQDALFEKFGIRNCCVVLDRIDVESMKDEVRRQHVTSTSKTKVQSVAPSKKSTIKRLKSKSKTFPPDPPIESSSEPTQIWSEDLDLITVVSSSTTSTTTSTFEVTSNTRSSRTNLRNASKNINYDESSNTTMMPIKTEIGVTDPPRSPAELLKRKSASFSSLNSICGTAGNVGCEMDRLFQGALITVTQCLACETRSECPGTFYDRSIPIDDTTTVCSTNNLEAQEDDCWIGKCLSNEGYLNDTSKYACDVCACKQEAKMHTQYTHVPPVLILHLLSYGYTSTHDGALNAQKLSNRSRLVNYFDFQCSSGNLNSVGSVSTTPSKTSAPELKSPTTRRQTQLQMQQKQLEFQMDMSSKHQFKLFAVVMHSGQTLNSGHYTAFINYKIVSQRHNLLTDDGTKSFKSQQTMNEKSVSSSNLIGGCNFTSSNESTISTRIKSPIPDQASLDVNVSSSSEPEWLHFDDTKVESMSNREFQRKIIDSSFNSPYILFYVRD